MLVMIGIRQMRKEKGPGNNPWSFLFAHLPVDVEQPQRLNLEESIAQLSNFPQE